MKFTTILCLLHDDMEVVAMTNGCTTDLFPIWTNVNQGCIIIPTLFLIYLSAMLHLTTDKLPAQMELACRTSGKLFNLHHLQAKTKVTPASVIELQHTESMGLILYIYKLKVFHQLGLALWSELPIIKVQGEALENIDHFQYLGSVLLAKADIDKEVLQCASTAFSRLRKRLFENNNIRSDMKIMVYRTVVVPTLLYDSVTWAIYSRHVKALKHYHYRCLRQILRICWEERRINTSTRPTPEALTILDWLRWAGHIICITDTRLPEQVLYLQLRNSRQGPAGQRKCFSDTLKASLAKCSIPTDTQESLAQDHPKWRRSIQE
eukprot:g38566.t1